MLCAVAVRQMLGAGRLLLTSGDAPRVTLTKKDKRGLLASCPLARLVARGARLLATVFAGHTV
jgi:hypothetical protein